MIWKVHIIAIYNKDYVWPWLQPSHQDMASQLQNSDRRTKEPTAIALKATLTTVGCCRWSSPSTNTSIKMTGKHNVSRTCLNYCKFYGLSLRQFSRNQVKPSTAPTVLIPLIQPTERFLIALFSITLPLYSIFYHITQNPPWEPPLYPGHSVCHCVCLVTRRIITIEQMFPISW